MQQVDYMDEGDDNMHNNPEYNMEMEYQSNVQNHDTRQVIMNAFDQYNIKEE